jgi:hypothetical protein
VRWLSGRKRRFAKRKRASRPTSIFLVNPSLFSTSPIERVGYCWLWRPCFGAPQGQSWGQFPSHDECVTPRCVGLPSHGATNPPHTGRSNCRNRQKNDCFKKFEDWRGVRARGCSTRTYHGVNVVLPRRRTEAPFSHSWSALPAHGSYLDAGDMPVGYAT